MAITRLRAYSLGLGLLLAAALAAAMGLALGASRSARVLPAAFSPAFDKAIPAAVSTMPLLNEHGERTDLAEIRGKVVVLADFLTSCQEECPITTGALMSVRETLRRDHLLNRVDFVEVTVDPGRDNPPRLLAYERYTGVDWTLLTGTTEQIGRFWKQFGTSYWRVPEDRPPGINWETGRPYTYDVDHSDDLFVIDAAGHERLLTEGMPSVSGRLTPRLYRLLSGQGIHDLHHPGPDAWTPDALLGALAWMLGTNVAASSRN